MRFNQQLITVINLKNRFSTLIIHLLSNIKHLFFDLDRTLWDFEANSKKALQQIFTEYKLENHIEHFNHFHHTYLRINNDLWKKYGKKKITKEELRDARFLKTLQYHEIHNQELADQISQAYIDLSPKQTKLFPNAINDDTQRFLAISEAVAHLDYAEGEEKVNEQAKETAPLGGE